MSRTYKDRGYEYRWPEERWDFDRDDDNPYLKKAGVKTKKKKHVDTEWHWMGTPSWWTHMFMIRPRRNAENRQLRCMSDIDEFDFVDVKRKNHLYYW